MVSLGAGHPPINMPRGMDPSNNGTVRQCYHRTFSTSGARECRHMVNLSWCSSRCQLVTHLSPQQIANLSPHMTRRSRLIWSATWESSRTSVFAVSSSSYLYPPRSCLQQRKGQKINLRNVLFLRSISWTPLELARNNFKRL